MPLETGNYAKDLVITNPPASDDYAQGADHLQFIKKVIRNSLTGFAGGSIVAGVVGGVANAYTLTPAQALPSYDLNLLVMFAPNISNTEASTLNISGLGVKAINTLENSALVANDLIAGTVYWLRYDGTSFRHVAITKRYVDAAIIGGSPPATETVAGIAEIATQAETNAGADDARIVSPLKFATNLAGRTITINGDTTGSGVLSIATTIAANAVTTAKIADANVTLGKLAANSVDASKIVDLSVGTVELATAAVTLGKMADVATSTVFYRKTAATGVPEVQTIATLKTDLLLTGTNSGDQTITLTGDVTGSGTGSFAATIAANAVTTAKILNDEVTYAKIQNISATSRVLGRITVGAGDTEELTGANIATISNASMDHGVLVGNADDDHPQYLLLGGRSGGQIAFGGTAASESLFFRSTAHATKGKLFFGGLNTSVYDEVTDRWGFGTASPGARVTFVAANPASPYAGVELLSGASGSYTAIGVGRVIPEGLFAIAGGASQYLGGAVAGDCILLSTAGRLLLAAGAVGSMIAVAISGQNLGLGSAPLFGTGAVSVFTIQNGTAPTTSPADMVQLYAKDSTAGASNLFARNELGVEEQLTGLSGYVAINFSRTSTTAFSDITGFPLFLAVGRYQFDAILYTESGLAGGVKATMQGTLTPASIIFECQTYSGNAIVVNTRATGLGTTVGAITAVTAATMKVHGSVDVSSAGSLTVQFAQNASDTTPSTVLRGSWFRIRKV